MKLKAWSVYLSSLLLAITFTIGCEVEVNDNTTDDEGPAAASASTGTSSDDGTEAESPATNADTKTTALTPENAKVEFIGVHTDKSKEDRHCGIAEFTGTLTTLADGSAPTALELKFDMDSIWTEFNGLTGHLKNEDFFNVPDYPTASFKSTSIEEGEGDMFKVTGDLTMHGETAPVTFDAKYWMDGEMPKLSSEFVIDRTNWGMDKVLEGVEKEVTIMLVIGEKTEPKESK